MANSALMRIRQGIKNCTFDLADYGARNNKALQFETYAKRFFSRLKEAHLGGQYSPNTIRAFKTDIFIHMIPFFEFCDIRDIKDEDLENFYSSLSRGLALSTRKHIFATLHIMLKKARKNKDIHIMPIFPKIIVPEPQTRWISEETQDSILQCIPDNHKPIFLFMMQQGVRPGEARALHWEDINWVEKTVEIHRTFAGSICLKRTKTKINRILPISDSAFNMLSSLKATSEFVFITVLGTPYTEGTVLNHIWAGAIKKSGREYVCLYEGTRHSFLSQAANAGVDAFQLQRFAGHTNSKTTERYVHINIDGLKMVLKKKETHSKPSPK